MKICVCGLWHLGSVTAACLAELGHTVWALDPDSKVIEDLKGGKPPIYEPGLEEAVRSGIEKGDLRFTTDAASALKDADHVWLAFDTPVDDNDVADIDLLQKNIRKIMPHIKDGAKVIISSQAPVGFTARMEKLFAASCPGKKAFFACSPENLRLGKAMESFMKPDRIVVGLRTMRDKQEFAPLFSSISSRVEWMRTESAEMTKHAINSFLALSVCFANEIAAICELTGADAGEVERGLKTEQRIGPKAYLRPGAAFAGGTLARDIDYLSKLSEKNGLPSVLLNSVKRSNDLHKGWIERTCLAAFKNLRGKKFAFLGLTYKPGTDTLRRSPAIELARTLTIKGASVSAFDPAVKSLDKKIASFISLKSGIKEAVLDCDAVVIMTEWKEFRELKNDEINIIAKRVVIDPNGFLENIFSVRGVRYISVGRAAKEIK